MTKNVHHDLIQYTTKSTVQAKIKFDY